MIVEPEIEFLVEESGKDQVAQARITNQQLSEEIEEMTKKLRLKRQILLENANLDRKNQTSTAKRKKPVKKTRITRFKNKHLSNNRGRAQSVPSPIRSDNIQEDFHVTNANINNVADKVIKLIKTNVIQKL